MNVKDDVSANWKMFKEAWCYYVTATELNKKPKEVQAGALCSVMGMDCVKVMNSLTTLTASDKKDPEKILSALSDHFMPQKHLLFERVKFGFANQAEKCLAELTSKLTAPSVRGHQSTKSSNSSKNSSCLTKLPASIKLIACAYLRVPISRLSNALLQTPLCRRVEKQDSYTYISRSKSVKPEPRFFTKNK